MIENINEPILPNWTEKDQYINNIISNVKYDNIINVVINSDTGEKLGIIGKLTTKYERSDIYEFELEILNFIPKEHYLKDQLRTYIKLDDITKKYCKIENKMVDKIYVDWNRYLKLNKIFNIISNKKVG